LVEFASSARIGLLKYIDLELFLTEKLGIKVDLVTKDGLKPSLKDTVLNEVVYV
jgi:predicted nucleotidyltransferase